MENFIAGTLEVNKEGAVYEGTVYDRWLKLRHKSGQLLTIFDPDAVSGELLVGSKYEVIVQANVFASIVYFPERQINPLYDNWQQGKILNLNWQAVGNNYLLSYDDLYKGNWILIETILGQLVIHPQDILQPIKQNGYLYWEESRIDLIAVIKHP